MGTGAVVPEVEAVRAALEPYAWRSFTPQLLARCALGALDRHRVLALLAAIPGARPGDNGPLQPAERDDLRVEVLVELMGAHRWRDLTVTALCAQLLEALAAWSVDRRRLDAELDRLLRGGA